MILGILISGFGSNLQAIIDAIDSNELHAKIGVVISSKDTAEGITKAKSNGIPVKVIPYKDGQNYSENDKSLIETLSNHKVDIVVLAGFLQIVSENIVDLYRGRIINVHPSLIPAFSGKGFYGKKVHEAVLQSGVKFTGATVHFVDEGTDTGPIILQEKVEVTEKDDVEAISKKVLSIEHRLLVKTLKLFSENKIKLIENKVQIF